MCMFSSYKSAWFDVGQDNNRLHCVLIRWCQTLEVQGDISGSDQISDKAWHQGAENEFGEWGRFEGILARLE